MEFWTDEQVAEWIRARINSQTPEDSTCDYKSSFDFSQKGKKELVKDVTGFANSSGGIILVGISEDPEQPHLPNRDSEGLPKTPGEFLRVEQLLLAGTSPMLPALLLREIPWTPDGLRVVYAIYHARSWSRPHRNECDTRFYKRQNESTLEMSEEEISYLYAERKATQITIDNYLKKVDYSKRLVTGKKVLSVSLVPLPVREPLMNFYSEMGRKFLKETMFFHNTSGNPWAPCMDGVVTHSGTIPGAFVAKILPTGALLYSNTAEHFEESNGLPIDFVVETMMDPNMIDFAQKLYRELEGMTQLHLRAEIVGLEKTKLVAVASRRLSVWQIGDHPEYFTGDLRLDLQITAKVLLENPDSIKQAMKDRLANYIGLWEAPRNT